MESAFLEPLVERLLDALVQKVAQHSHALIYFQTDLEWLMRKLKVLKGLLKYADGKSTQNDPVKNWLSDLCDLAYNAEDVLDECLLVEPHSRSFCTSTQLVFRYRMGRKIRNVKKRLQSILKDAAELKLLHDVSDQHQLSNTIVVRTDWKRSSVLRNESQTVDMEDKIQTIINWLREPGVRVIAVVGMGGLGKTLLLQHVFKRAKDDCSFTNSAWLSVSQNFSVKTLQCDIADKINVNVKDVSEERAAERIHGCLQGKTSLIVLDDVWQEDRLVERIGLPDESGCKIVISTRSMDVSTKMRARIYKMETLSEENSWKLFCFHAFPDCEQSLPQEVEEIAHEVEKLCGGLPLAVKTIAACMARLERRPNEWRSGLERLQKDVMPNDVMPTLRLSYDALPSHLKPCFLYCSAFPEDYEIDCERLIELWIGEGFICTGENENPLDEGWAYLNELIDRCLIQFSHSGDSLGAYILEDSCKMHDLLRELCLSISREENKCVFEAGKRLEQFPPTLEKSFRRISLIGNDIREIPKSNDSSGLRTLLLSWNGKIENIPASFFRNLKSLRVLDLSGTAIKSLPKAVENLKLLRVLDISFTAIEELPESVRRLKGLQYLDVSYCQSLKRLPEGISELKCMRHLSVTDSIGMPKGVGKLTSLETLGEFRCESRSGLTLEDLKDLTRLRELKVIIGNEWDLKCIGEGILGVFVKMRILSIKNDLYSDGSDYVVPRLSENMASLKEFERIHLFGFAVPNCVSSFQNLMVLQLTKCECLDYPALETLPNLIHLFLWTNRKCSELRKEFGKRGGFPKLETLQLWNFPKLEELPIMEEGAMPNLKILKLDSLPLVKRMAEGLQRLTSLEEIYLEGCTAWEEEMEEPGEEWQKMKDFCKKSDLESLMRKLKVLKGFLKDVDGKSRQNDPVKNWLSNLWDLAYNAEDVLDECLLVEPRDHSHYWKRSCVLRNESQTVDMEDKIQKIINWLKEPGNFSVKTLQCDIADKLNVNVKDVSEERVAERINGCLQDKTSLIVLDDVWQEDRLVERIGLPDETCMARLERRPNEWRLRLVSLQKVVMSTLRLSYDALPSHLKPYFLYCSAFPEDSEIKCEHLIELWIGEGFICTGENENPLDEGWAYINEIIDRCLIQLVDKSGILSWCKMHDLLRELCLSISREENKCVFEAGKGLEQFPPTLEKSLRRISLIRNDIRAILESKEFSGLRTLLLSWNGKIENIPTSFFRNLKSLRGECLDYPALETLPNLRALDLFTNKRCGELWEEFGKRAEFSKLETLQLSYFPKLEELPRMEEGAMPNLKSLSLNSLPLVKRMAEGLQRMTSLEEIYLEGCTAWEEAMEERGEEWQKMKAFRITSGSGVGFSTKIKVILANTDRDSLSTLIEGTSSTEDRAPGILLRHYSLHQ
eukprot:Gb_40379 [translate_table: standard]